MDASESSAQSRVEAWGLGLQMLKANPIFGVGYGRFTEFHDKVAHNSFVHAFAELGLFGATLLVGCFYAFFQSIRVWVRNGQADSSAATSAQSLCLSALGAIVCGFFLSRQYVAVPYLLIAMGTSRATMSVADHRLFWSNTTLHSLFVVMVTAFGLVAIWIAVRLLGMW
jgi:O-antigen ligase